MTPSPVTVRGDIVEEILNGRGMGGMKIEISAPRSPSTSDCKIECVYLLDYFIN